MFSFKYPKQVSLNIIYDVTYFRAFKKVIDVNVSEIELNLCMHFVKSFMYGY